MLSVENFRENPERLFDEREVAAALEKSRAWMQRHRWAGTGIKYVRIGRTPKYRGRDIIAYIESRIVETDAAA